MKTSEQVLMMLKQYEQYVKQVLTETQKVRAKGHIECLNWVLMSDVEFAFYRGEFSTKDSQTDDLKKTLDDMTRHFHPLFGDWPDPKDCSDCQKRAKFGFDPMFHEKNFPGSTEALKAYETN